MNFSILPLSRKTQVRRNNVEVRNYDQTNSLQGNLKSFSRSIFAPSVQDHFEYEDCSKLNTHISEFNKKGLRKTDERDH